VYAFALLDELIPLYAVYALMFADAGLTTGRISTLLLLWSLTTFALEVPSGALADRISRRHMLGVAALLRAAGFALWVTVPSYAGFALGFVLWGMKSALTSGTWEALIYDELTAAGVADRYARVVGRAEVLGTLGVIGGTLIASPLMKLGGYAIAGWASVVVCIAGAALAVSLPERPAVEASADGEATAGGYFATLRAGLAEAASSAVLRRLIVIAALLPGLTAVDEYLSLLGRAVGASNTLVPVLLALQYTGLAVGAELAGRRPGVSPKRAALLTVIGALVLAAGALSGHPLGFLGVGLWYATIWFGTVISGARLQEQMTGAARATVTSVAGLGTEAVSLAVFAAFGLAARWASVPVLVASLAAPMLLVATVMPRWLPHRRALANVTMAAGEAAEKAAEEGAAAPGSNAPGTVAASGGVATP
jgi:MFS family permease